MDTYLGVSGNHSGATFDKALELVEPDGDLATEGSAAVEIGAGLVDAQLVIDLATPASAAATITMQFCDKEDFSADVVSGIAVAVAASQAGRVIAPFRNDPAGVPLPYVRLMPSAAAKLGAFIAKR